MKEAYFAGGCFWCVTPIYKMYGVDKVICGYAGGSEKNLASIKLKEIEKNAGKETHVALLPYKNFYEAEEYHQDYYLKNPEAFEKELIESGRKKAD